MMKETLNPVGATSGRF